MSKERGKKFNSFHRIWCELNSSCVTPPMCRFSLQWLIGDRDSHCGVVCARTQVKPMCGSDGRSYESTCELQRARCKDKTLTLAHRGRCRGEDRTVNEWKKKSKMTKECLFFACQVETGWKSTSCRRPQCRLQCLNPETWRWKVRTWKHHISTLMESWGDELKGNTVLRFQDSNPALNHAPVCNPVIFPWGD